MIVFPCNDDNLHTMVEIPPINVLDEPHYPNKVENQINSSSLSSRSNQICYSRASSQSSRASQEGDQELALEFQHRSQLGILIRPRLDHHHVIESRAIRYLAAARALRVQLQVPKVIKNWRLSSSTDLSWAF